MRFFLFEQVEELRDVLLAEVEFRVIVDEEARHAHDVVLFLDLGEEAQVVDVRLDMRVERRDALSARDELGAHRAREAYHDGDMVIVLDLLDA